LQVEM